MSLEGNAPSAASTTEGLQQGAETQQPKWTVNEPDGTEGEGSGVESADEGDQLEQAIKKVEKKAFGKKPVEEKAEDSEEKPAPQKRKFKVDGEEIELDDETAARYTQKGIMLEKRGAEISREKRALQEQFAQVEQLKGQIHSFMESLEKDPVRYLVSKLGEDKAREIMEPFLAEKVREELLPEHEKVVLSERRAREKAEAELKQIRDSQNQEKMTKEEAQHLDGYKRLIIDALSIGGVPKTDFTAAEMANYIRRAEERNIQYTPEQLSTLVREDNVMRVNSLVGQYTSQVEAARKSGDKATVLKAGQALADMLGENVVHALAKYHLEKSRGVQPTVPKKTLDSPKLKEDPTKSRKGAYAMTEDEFREERKRRAEAIDRGEAVGEW